MDQIEVKSLLDILDEKHIDKLRSGIVDILINHAKQEVSETSVNFYDVGDTMQAALEHASDSVYDKLEKLYKGKLLEIAKQSVDDFIKTNSESENAKY